MHRYDRLTWIAFSATLCVTLYLVSYYPLRAARVRVPALRHPLVMLAFEPARRVAESESLSRPMQWWERVWGGSTKCHPAFLNLELALHNYWDAHGTESASASDDSGPGQFPPID